MFCTSSDDALNFYEVSWKYLDRFSSYRADTKLQLSNLKLRIIKKMYRQDLRFLCSARRLIMLYISMKFHENILKLFVIERTQNYHSQISKGNNSKNVYTRDIFCTSSDEVYISTKFYENILNGFQVIERRRNRHCQISKGNNLKKCIGKSNSSCGLHVI